MAKFIKPKSEPVGNAAWLLTYADMMSLLLAFFVAIVSYSTVNAEKYEEAVQSLQGAFRTSGLSLGGLLSPRPTAQLEKAARDLQATLQVAGRDKDVRVIYEFGDAVRITIAGALLFDDASSDLRPESHEVLAAVAAMLAQVPEREVEVEGHLDAAELPASAYYRDALDLSHQRADAVARRLAEYARQPMDGFCVTGCGAARPAATNDSEAGRAANRRVEILVRGVSESSKIRAARKQIEGIARSTGGPAGPTTP